MPSLMLSGRPHSLPRWGGCTSRERLAEHLHLYTTRSNAYAMMTSLVPVVLDQPLQVFTSRRKHTAVNGSGGESSRLAADSPSSVRRGHICIKSSNSSTVASTQSHSVKCQLTPGHMKKRTCMHTSKSVDLNGANISIAIPQCHWNSCNTCVAWHNDVSSLT